MECIKTTRGDYWVEEWFQDERRHRDDGPAWENSFGSKEWFQNGMRHRLDGPSVIHPNGYQAYYRYGFRHRLDGPAVECPDGDNQWWIEGTKLTQSEFEQRDKSGRVIIVDGVEYNFF